MSQLDEVNQYTEWFRAFGASEPESWATSQVHESINQWARFVFLQQAWRAVVADGDTSWIAWQLKDAVEHPGAPGTAAGLALQRLLAAGAAPEDLADVVRVMQWHMLARLAYQLADYGMVKYPSETMPRVRWALFELDEDDRPLREIGMLHESVLDTDPTGREMMPRNDETENL